MSRVKSKKSESWLVFVDTNILLDFYRLRGESAIKQLDALIRHRDSIITGEQVKMEYLKHRQAVVLETIRELKKPVDQKLPPILSNYQAATTMKARTSEAIKKYEIVKEKAELIITSPARHDEVYKKLNRVFSSKSNVNLGRNHKLRHSLRSAARKRFSLGYPPRKKNDISIGDAYNWEWIIKCAQECKENSHVLIVSRDGDFGGEFGGKAILNDWLQHEFKDRVSRKRKVELTTRLTVAMKRLDETVTKQEEEDEIEVIKSSHARSNYQDILQRLAESQDDLEERLFEFRKKLSIDPEKFEVFRAAFEASNYLRKSYISLEGEATGDGEEAGD